MISMSVHVCPGCGAGFPVADLRTGPRHCTPCASGDVTQVQPTSQSIADEARRRAAALRLPRNWQQVRVTLRLPPGWSDQRQEPYDPD